MSAPVLKAPVPTDVRAICPLCGSDVVWNVYKVGGQYEQYWECMGTLQAPEARTCDYRVLWPLNGQPVVLGKAGERQQTGG